MDASDVEPSSKNGELPRLYPSTAEEKNFLSEPIQSTTTKSDMKVTKAQQGAEMPCVKVCEDDDDDIKCGLPGCHPPCLQPFASIGGYMFLYSFVAILQGAFFTYFIAVISTIEKRFGIRSRTTGVVMSGNDVSQILLSIVLNYYGGKGHRPRWLAGGMLCVVICSVILALPHFILGPGDLYDSELSKVESLQNASLTTAGSALEMNEGNLCKAALVESQEKGSADEFVVEADCQDDDQANVAMTLMFVAHFVGGVGLCLFFPLSWSFYDDNVHPRHAPFFHGFSSAIRVIGPFFGFLVGFACLKVYVEPSRDPGFGPEDPRWLGAWWLGFVIFGGALLITAGFTAIFPRRIPTEYSNAEAAKKKLKGEDCKDKDVKLLDGFKDILVVLKRLVKNRIFMFNLVAACFHIFGFIGFFSFSPKYIETQFRVSAANSSISSGIAGVLVQVFGMLGAGFVVRKYKPRAKYATGYCALVSGIMIAGFILSIFIGCPNLNMQGQHDSNGLSLTSPCNEDCNCPTSFYDPICAEDGSIHFYSPCHAGCRSLSDGANQANKTIYSNCECIKGDGDADQLGNAIHGYCDSDSTACNTFLTYLIVVGVTKFISSTARVVGLMIIMRCVQKDDKPVALATMVTAVAIFSSIPSPIFFGSIIDSTCLVWKTSKCGAKANCSFYDGDSFRYSLHAWTAAFIACAMIFEILIVFRSKDLDLYGEEEEKEKERGNEIGDILSSAVPNTPVDSK